MRRTGTDGVTPSVSATENDQQTQQATNVPNGNGAQSNNGTLATANNESGHEHPYK